jgi:UV DNA damage repair endonuclease
MPEPLRMFRLGSDILPLYTATNIYKDPVFDKEIQDYFSKLGKFARKNNIRLSFHPAQFVVLNSTSKDVVSRSIEELEYHAFVAACMGYTGFHTDGFCINIHCGSKAGKVEGFKQGFRRLSKVAKNLVTVENDEYSYGPKALLDAGCPVVLDLHHFWVMNGFYLKHDSELVKQVIATWKGVRPKLHYSISKEEYVPENFGVKRIPKRFLVESNITKSKLRKHADLCWNESVNNYALKFNDFDIMVEAKLKNIAAHGLYVESLR